MSARLPKIKEINIEVAYAAADLQLICPITIPVNTTIQKVFDLAVIKQKLNNLDIMQYQIGVFGVIKSLDYVLKHGDRLEIYRNLIIDPKEARKKKAKQHAKKK